MTNKRGIEDLRNLGTYSRQKLELLGVTNREQLAQMGSVEAYLRLHALGEKISLNFVYAVEAALLDIHWTALPRELKQQLKQQIADGATPETRSV